MVRIIAVKQGALERGIMIRIERITDMSPLSLVDQNKGDLVVKGPLQKRVIVTFHENEMQREVCFVARTIPIQVCSNTHLVTSLCCEERKTIYGSCTLSELRYLWNSP